MASLLASSLLAVVLVAPPGEVPPGGYWTLGEQAERASEPPDGEYELTIGSVLFSLGLLRAGAGVATAWVAGRPDLCPGATEEDCSGLRIYGWVGVGEGALMFTTGVVYLAIGGTRRSKHQRWERGEDIALGPGRLAPRLRIAPFVPQLAAQSGSWAGGGGLRLRLRF